MNTPKRLADFLEKEAATYEKHWVDLATKTGEHPLGWCQVRFPKKAAKLFETAGVELEQRDGVIPLATLYDEDKIEMPEFLAVRADDSCAVLVYDATNGEGFFEEAPSLDAFVKRLKKKRG